MKIIKFLCKILCYILGKVQWWLHLLFPKSIPAISCYGCMNDICGHRCTKYNAICYYHKRKDRDLK